MPNIGSVAANLSPAFQGRIPTFLTDAPELVTLLREAGANAFRFEEAERLGAGDLRDVVAIPLEHNRTPATAYFEKHLGQSSVMVLPISSFSGTVEAAVYYLEMLNELDLLKSAAGAMQWVERLETASRIHMVGDGTDITVELGDQVYLMSPKVEVELAASEWSSIPQYLEIGLISPPHTYEPAHRMYGHFSAPGFVVAHHRFAQAVAGPLARQAWRYLCDTQERHGGARFEVDVEDSQVRDVRCGGQSVLEEVLSFVDQDKERYLMEFAFASCPQWDLDSVDWTINSQINESVSGMHIAVGTGVQGAHIDFVAPNVELSA